MLLYGHIPYIDAVDGRLDLSVYTLGQQENIFRVTGVRSTSFLSLAALHAAAGGATWQPVLPPPPVVVPPVVVPPVVVPPVVVVSPWVPPDEDPDYDVGIGGPLPVPPVVVVSPWVPPDEDPDYDVGIGGPLPLPPVDDPFRGVVPKIMPMPVLPIDGGEGGKRSIMVVALATVASRFGMPVALGLFRALGVSQGARLTWQAVGGPVWTGFRFVLEGLGIKEGMDIVLDWDSGDGGGGGGNLPVLPVQGGLPGVVGSWTANGVLFYRLSDGRMACQNKVGRWKVWRPKRPIVIMPGGATSLKTLLRADRTLNAQAKQLDAMLRRRVGRRQAKPRQQRATGDIIVEAGPGSVVKRGG